MRLSHEDAARAVALVEDIHSAMQRYRELAIYDRSRGSTIGVQVPGMANFSPCKEVWIQTLHWPARSPDINPTEHVWAMLGRNVQRRDINTLAQLRATLLEEWDLISQEVLQRDSIKIAAEQSIGYYEIKNEKPWFDKDCCTVVERRKQEKLKFLQDPVERNKDIYSNERQEASRTLRYKKRDYLKEKLNEPEWETDLPLGTETVMSAKGSMTTAVFVHWLDQFARYKVAGEVALIFDGASSHLDANITSATDNYRITLYCLSSNTTHGLQPMDKVQAVVGCVLCVKKIVLRTCHYVHIVRVKEYREKRTAFFKNIICNDSEENWDDALNVQAQGYLNFFTQFQNIFLLEVYARVFAHTDVLYNILQTKSLDIAYYLQEVSKLKKNTISEFRRSGFPSIWSNMENENSSANTMEPPLKRRKGDDELKYRQLYYCTTAY
ncbi:hypothetical protein ANN_01117 [Periplaneta americana]|uniref:DDE-1 domain-containing protein n=1 Tax=Periplaneta americana TaxID=6978 RepID=A0ABQ8TSN7_PERAM|nr:hypothetical protein ANN_01117 [Periplaneta americana]